ncbi:hypothetical protein BH10CYA1_BH10CYA1_54480 [soil metagenome]
MSTNASICLPVYNGERYLAQAIESVLAQSCEDFELLIADDCSKDESTAIIKKFARQDPRIRLWIHDKNKGLFANYNFLISACSAPIIKLFAQDDVLMPNSLSHSLAVLEKHANVSLVSHARRWIDENGTDISDTNLIPQAHHFVTSDSPVASKVVLKKSLLPVVNFIGEPSTVAFRRSHSARFFDEKFHHLGDLDYWLRSFASGDYFYISEALCQFRLHNESRSQINTKRLLFLPDQLRLWHNVSSLVGDSISEDQFMEHMLVGGARDVNFFENAGHLSVEGVRSVKLTPETEESLKNDGYVSQETYEQALDELRDFREITYRSCRLIGERLSGLGARTVSTMYENEQKIKALKRNRRRLLRSVPKQSVLRSINRHIGVEAGGETAKLQKSYIQFLQMQLWLIRTFQSKRKIGKVLPLKARHQ